MPDAVAVGARAAVKTPLEATSSKGSFIMKSGTIVVLVAAADMTQFKQKYLLYGIIVLTVIGTILIGGCVEKLAEEPINGTETEEKPAEEPVRETPMVPIEEPQKEVNTPEEHKEATPATAPEQMSSRLIKWAKENGIRTGGVSSSTIIKDNEYWMYYTLDGIHLATSPDGLSFVNSGNVVENGPIGSEQEMVTNPAVFKLSDGRYRMIYEGSKLAEDETGKRYHANRKLYSAVSSDGKEWVKEGGVRFWDYGDGKPGELFTSVPDVIRLPDGRLRMYYTRGATSATALSDDEGLTWAKETNLELRKVAVDPDIVLLDDGTYKLFFTTFADEFGFGEQWVVSASSADGINFAIDDGKIIEPGASGGLVTDPDVIKTDNGYRMYYGEFKKGEYESSILSAFIFGSG